MTTERPQVGDKVQVSRHDYGTVISLMESGFYYEDRSGDCTRYFSYGLPSASFMVTEKAPRPMMRFADGMVAQWTSPDPTVNPAHYLRVNGKWLSGKGDEVSDDVIDSCIKLGTLEVIAGPDTRAYPAPL